MTTQPRLALKLANQTREDRKLITRRFAAGDLSLETALSAECCWTLPVWKLLAFLPWWGKERARRLLRPLGLDHEATIGTLTDQQRQLLVTAYRREVAQMSHGRRGRRS